MAQQNFVDYVRICGRSGAGGAGSAHFFRDKTTPMGGPDGGDGGRGGHVIIRGNEQLWTLLPLKYRKHVIAGPGYNGTDNNKTGAQGKDVILEVPLGTIAKDAETGEVMWEITDHEEERILVKGGKGGLGNSYFKSSTNRAPRFAQPGQPGREEWKILELKILADVGLVGFPNAGKSTLLSVLSAAKPKIANYSFTTLVPNLGIVSYRNGRSFIMADIPGIIEGAAEGKGLGIRFLRHIERNSLLLFVIAGDSLDIEKEYRILLGELEKYNPELMDKPKLLCLSKADLLDDELKEMVESELSIDIPYVFISAVAQKGLDELKDKIWKVISDDD